MFLSCVSNIFEQFARDDEQLHFSRALVNAQGTDVAVQALNGLFADNAQATPELHGSVRCV